MKLAILTPTYNRGKLLIKLFQSLVNQSLHDFIWIIIDDGSTDNTEDIVKDIIQTNSLFETRYLYKDNHGKHTALNKAFSVYTDIDFFAVVDSDDVLLSNGIEEIYKYSFGNFNNDIVGAIFFRYNNIYGDVLHSKGKYLSSEKVLDRYEHDKLYSKDDGCMGYYKKVISKYQYPIFDKENYIGPIVIQMEMANEYKILFTNSIVGIAEYHNDGLSMSGRKLRIKNPYGMIKYCSLFQNDKVNTFKRFKYNIMAHSYMIMNKINLSDLQKANINITTNPFTFLLGLLLALLWQIEK